MEYEYYSLRGDELVQDNEWMSSFSHKVLAMSGSYLTTAYTKDVVVSADSMYCTVVNRIAANELQAEGIAIEYLEHERERGSVSHAFLRSQRGPRKNIFDFQYLQFVPHDQREGLPPYLVINYTSKEEVVAGLIEHRVPQIYHNYWLEELFWEIHQ